MSKIQINQDLSVSYADEGPWRSYQLTAEGDTLSEVLESATIGEIDQEGDILDLYDIEEASSGEVRRAALRAIEKACKAEVNAIIKGAGEYEDGETGTTRCIEMYCEEHGLSMAAANLADTVCLRDSALEAGIPLSVIEGRTKLTDHFSQDYIDEKSGRNSEYEKAKG